MKQGIMLSRIITAARTIQRASEWVKDDDSDYARELQAEADQLLDFVCAALSSKEME